MDTGKIAKNSSSKIVEIKNEDITLYPIPAIDNLFIKTTKELKNSTIKIFDVSNRLVLENKISIINTASVDISNLLKGTYFIEITNENSKLKYFKKFVKE